jgi:hypothetical protein
MDEGRIVPNPAVFDAEEAGTVEVMGGEEDEEMKVRRSRLVDG